MSDKRKPSAPSSGSGLSDLWNPIETAPSGKRVLVWIGEAAIGTFNEKAFDGQRWEDDGLEPVPFIIAPTHWMPLPSEPNQDLSYGDQKEEQ